MASPPGGSSRPLRFLLPVLVVVGLLVIYQFVWRGGEDALVVYCAHDSVYSQRILDDFTRETGIRVAPVFDTEATKSLGLVERLVAERDSPRCDVFWNNQLLGMLDLAGRGLLVPYKGSGYERIPAAYRDPEGHWAGFAARFRVYIVNTGKLAATPEAVAERLGGDLSRVAIAKPLYGTTLTHYSVLWHHWGGEKLEAWHADLRTRGIREATGNAHVKNLVAEGVCDLGLTDTDDFFVARDAGKPVAMVPVRLESGATLCMPNTVGIIKGTRRLARAQRLVDHLLSAACELELAGSKARQVPLGPVDASRLGDDVRVLASWVADGVPLGGLGPARAACLAWLKTDYVR